MSRMMHNGDISYSSISAPNNYNGSGNRGDSCARSCFLSLPYATITSTFLVISGMIISFISVHYLAGVFDRLTQDLFYKRYLWINELRVFLLFGGGFLALIIITNLIIGFATSSSNLESKAGAGGGGGSGCANCTRHSTTDCLVRFVFLLNQLIFLLVLLLVLVFTLTSFVCYLLSTLCDDRAAIEPGYPLINQGGPPTDGLSPLGGGSGGGTFEQHQPANSINLQPFAPMLFLRGNETALLLFRDYRLKSLCRDYIGTLLLYNLISLLGAALLYVGFHCYLINLTVNRIRLASFKKYTELLYLSCGTEMNTFQDASYDHGERF
ncbi:Neuronal membrane glycoprotein M6-b [Tyrophagus putrescentiae]|nr:Neuronal membrane glycoprotein M6-b [Tyrophagus putrescentiae]